MTFADRCWRLAAVLLFLIGLAVNVWRPLAPRLPQAPVDLERFSPAVLDAVAAYRQPRLWVAIVTLLVVSLLPGALLLTARGRRLVVAVSDRRGEGEQATPTRTGDALRGAAVAAVLVLVVRAAVFGLDVWIGYVHERQWAFRTAGLGPWLRDWGIGVGVEALVAAVAGGLFVVLLRRWPRHWHHRMVVAATLLSAALVLLQPLVVQPLLLSTKPLPPGAMRDRLEQVVASAGMDAALTVGDASRRTTKVNAYVTGLGPSRQVVLYDTLLARPVDEVAAVVAHELAHRENRDLPRGVLLTPAGLLPFVLVLRRVLDGSWVAGHLAMRRAGDPRAVAVLVATAALAQALVLPVVMWTSRRAEAAADHGALILTKDPAPLVASFRGFVERDLSWPSPPLVAVVLFGSHPSVDRRIRAVVTEAERAGLPVPRREDLVGSEVSSPRVAE